MQEHRFVSVDGIETSYYEAGDGRPLVLVHGGGFGSTYNAYHWSLNFDELAKHFHVYALDKLGQGYTGNPAVDADYTMAATIAHVHGFLRALDIEGAVLVGHSRGALPVTRIAMDDPKRASAIVILDTNTLAPEDPATPTDFYDKLGIEPPASRRSTSAVSPWPTPTPRTTSPTISCRRWWRSSGSRSPRWRRRRCASSVRLSSSPTSESNGRTRSP